jgi:hypothetical protein
MTFPAILFGCLIATLIGSAFHLWQGGNLGKLILYLTLSWLGFWGGQVLFDFLGWSFLSLGSIHLGSNLVICSLTLGLGFWLGKGNSRLEKPTPKKYRIQ